NLTGAETFYSERRPFFTEGADQFRYGLSIADWLFGSEELFYSRRIGRAPQIDFPDSATSTAPVEPTRLLAAAKLSGRSRGWSIGALSAATAEERANYLFAGG